MTSSKFVEILDTSDMPFSQDNVSLEDILGDKRHRSDSQGSIPSPTEDKSMASAQAMHSYAQPSKTRLRGLSLRKKT